MCEYAALNAALHNIEKKKLLVSILFPVAVNAVSDIGRAVSQVKSKVDAMIAEKFVAPT